MVKHLQSTTESLYGYPQGVVPQFPSPFVANRAPSTLDTGFPLGQIFVDKLHGTVSMLVTNAGGTATWLSLGGSLTPTVVTATATNFVTATVATATTLNANRWSGTGTDAAINLLLTPKGAGGVTVTTGALTVTAGAITATLGGITATNGNISMGTIGNGLRVTEGVNARMGQATLIAGTIVVANTSVAATTRIFLTRSSINGSAAIGMISAGTITPGVSFVINALNPAAPAGLIAADVSIVNWFLVEAL